MNYSLTLATLVLFSTACSIQATTAPQQPKLSSTVATHAIYPSTSAQSDGTNLTVYAALVSGQFLTLSGDDKLSATVGDAPDQPLVLEPNSGTAPHYWLTVPSPEKLTNVTIHLSRANGEVDNVALVVPPPFALATPPTNVVGGKPLSVTVSPAPAAVSSSDLWLAYLDGPCTSGSSPILGSVQNDQVSFAVDAQLRPKNSAPSCAVTVKIQHQLVGKADAAFSKPFASDTVGVEERRFSAQLTW